MMITTFDQRADYLASAIDLELSVTRERPSVEGADPKVWPIATPAVDQRPGYIRAAVEWDLGHREPGQG